MLKSAEMGALLKEQAAGIAARCGSGYGTDIKMMETRVIASVFTDTIEAAKENLQNNTILRALS